MPRKRKSPQMVVLVDEVDRAKIVAEVVTEEGRVPLPLSLNSKRLKRRAQRDGKLKPTSKQWLCAHWYVKGKSKTEAYALAYPDQIPLMSPRRHHNRAVAVFSRPPISDLVSQMQAELSAMRLRTIPQYLDDLEAAGLAALADGDHKTRVKSLELMGRVLGYYVDRSVSVQVTRDEASLTRDLELIQQAHPQLFPLAPRAQLSAPPIVAEMPAPQAGAEPAPRVAETTSPQTTVAPTDRAKTP